MMPPSEPARQLGEGRAAATAGDLEHPHALRLHVTKGDDAFSHCQRVTFLAASMPCSITIMHS